MLFIGHDDLRCKLKKISAPPNARKALTHLLLDFIEGLLPLEPPLRIRKDERDGLGRAVGPAHRQVQVHALLGVGALALGQLPAQLGEQAASDVVKVLVGAVQAGGGVAYVIRSKFRRG